MAKAKIAAPPRRSHEVLCKGGPWHNKLVWFPCQDSGDPLSLPILVRGHDFRGVPETFRGRYNLNDGRWVPTIDPNDDK